MLPKIKCIVVDDDKLIREQMRLKIEKNFPQIDLLALCVNGQEGYDAFNKYNPELIFLDVEMDDMTGFEMLEKLPHSNFEVVFCTSFNHYAIKAIKFSAFDYLLKPINLDELNHTVHRFIEKRRTPYERELLLQNLLDNARKTDNKDFRLAVKTFSRTYFLDTETIVHLEASNNYTFVVLNNKTRILSSKSLIEYEKILIEYGFIRIHRSHLVNKKHVMEITNDNFVILRGDIALPISRSKTAQVKANIKN